MPQIRHTKKSEESTYMKNMKKCFLPAAVALFAAPAAVVLFSATFAHAAANAPQSGKVISEQSVNCGEKGSKKKLDLLCQEYVIHGTSTDYHVRQKNPGSQALVPVNTAVQFTLDKDKMKFKIDGKSYEYVVVSETAVAGS
jgi:hypothetical protein